MLRTVRPGSRSRRRMRCAARLLFFLRCGGTRSHGLSAAADGAGARQRAPRLCEAKLKNRLAAPCRCLNTPITMIPDRTGQSKQQGGHSGERTPENGVSLKQHKPLRAPRPRPAVWRPSRPKKRIKDAPPLAESTPMSRRRTARRREQPPTGPLCRLGENRVGPRHDPGSFKHP